MTKWTKFITLTSVVVLAAASPLSAVMAETPTDSRTSVVVPSDPGTPAVTNPTPNPTTPSTVPSDGTTIPTVPTTPTEPTTPGETPTVTPSGEEPTSPSTTNPSTTTPTTNPSTTPGTTEPTTPTPSTPEPKAEEPSTTDPASKVDEPETTVPTINGGTATVTPNTNVPTNNPNVSAQTAANAGASQVGTTSQVTGQIVSNVSAQEPVYTNTGYQIVSTQNSQVVVAYADGSTDTVAPETIGATVNEDKTISVQTASGEMKTLPSTGEKGGLLASLSGIILLALAWVLRKKNRQA
ncbi:LPXTG cell wall anchor domain-containing protein [Streptococcus constellatus]|uniref:Gram-positive cocci surface proteins LPxTG domain-containing protein n=1 Tax=Streptococcus constellatus TaxID=76860 RepID=A0A0C1KHU9_STRCV|nr:LPXTG cell wall anchor domain-containing protein [Streptococcus constellatus]KIC78487.1 hypothetical protein RN79_02665 [Streptococcus constellatus]